MNKITGFLFAFLMVTIGFAQGHETFDNFDEPETSYETGTFIGQDGSTWNYVEARGDTQAEIEEGNKAIMLGRNRTPDAELTSGTLQNGIGTLMFTYMQAFSSDVELEVYVNDDLVYTATSDGQQGEAITTDEIVVNAEGDFTLRFFNPNGGQVSIDDIIWTGTSDETTLNITSPSDGHVYPPEVLATIQFNITNFDISTDADAGDGDGYVQYQIDEGDFNNHFTTQAIELDELTAPGEHEVVLRLVDNDGDPIDGLTDSVTFFLSEYIEVSTIGELREGTLDGYYTLTGEAVLTYQQNFRNQKYIQDDTGAILIDDNPGVITTTYNRYDGITGITGVLNKNNGLMQFQPMHDTDAATSTNNSIVPIIISIEDLMSDPDAYESQVIAFENVRFDLADDEVEFETGHNYTLIDENDNTTTMRTNFFDADYIGDPIPTGFQDAMVGIAARFYEDGQIFIRDTDDLEGTPLSTESFDKNEVSVYPNPASNVLNIALEGKAQVEIYSILGKRVVQTEVQNQKAIAVDNLISGVYLVKIIQDGKAVTKKLIIQ
ncbi:MAG TPA: T9SS type A sorting domain-containing protein [Flavobacteriaceae bacterium]|nr:T9SS type A sorting domain-containing protein [Flavobacteriaceae bacterium]